MFKARGFGRSNTGHSLTLCSVPSHLVFGDRNGRFCTNAICAVRTLTCVMTTMMASLLTGSLLVMEPARAQQNDQSSVQATVQAKKKSTEKKAKMDKQFVYIGTYTNTTSKGIYIYSLDSNTGKLTEVGTAPKVDSPSFLTISPNHKFLYAANEVDSFEGGKTGGVSAFSIDGKTGALSLLNQKASAGTGPCYVSIDAKGKNVLVANYGAGTVAVLPVDTDGKLKDASCTIQHKGSGPNAARQEGPHAHSINLDAGNYFAFAADLGVDKLFVYKFDGAHGTLTPNQPAFAPLAPGAGPRHMVFSPNGTHAYVINELKSTITLFDYDKGHGSLKEVETVSTLPESFTGSNTTAEVQIHPTGKFVYGSNRGHNSLAIFSVDATSGKLTLVGHESTQGKTPRNFRIDLTGKYLLAANQDTDNVVVYKIDTATGKLSQTGQQLSIPVPVCVKFIPAE